MTKLNNIIVRTLALRVKSIVLLGIATFQVYPFYFFELSVFDLLELFESMTLP